MPNICENILELIGDKEDLKKFDEKFKGIYMDFHSMNLQKSEVKIVTDYIATKKYMKYMEWVTDDAETFLKEDGTPEILHSKIEYVQNDTSVTLYVPYMKKGYSLNNFIPLAENFHDWYDWRVRNWGSKWDVIDTEQLSKDSYTYYFTTAWGPVLEAIFKLSELYPDILFDYRYSEPGCELGGYYRIKDNETLKCVLPETTLEYRDFTVTYMGDTYEYNCEECTCPLEEFEIDDDTESITCPHCSHINKIEFEKEDEESKEGDK